MGACYADDVGQLMLSSLLSALSPSAVLVPGCLKAPLLKWFVASLKLGLICDFSLLQQCFIALHYALLAFQSC